MKAIRLILFLLYPLVGVAQDEKVSVRKAVEGNTKQEYFLINHSAGVKPDGGYKLLLVLPGGDGSADFNPFVTNLGKHAAGKDYLVAQLVSVKWTPDQKIIWPTEKSRVKKAKFTTEEFVDAVINDIQKNHKINPEHIYTLAWSSSGPAAYAASLEVDEIKGSFIAMSVFKPDQLSKLSNAKGHRYYLYHSPEDKVCPIRMARDAERELSGADAEVEFSTYAGGHGWHGNIFGAIRAGIGWLEER
ncbi:MAG: alpha/beta hydrolase [Verrucomicrobiales bacterium]